MTAFFICLLPLPTHLHATILLSLISTYLTHSSCPPNTHAETNTHFRKFKSLSDVSHQTEVISTLQNAVETNRLPHLLFYGPPGTGKTSVALALCRTLWHPSQLKRRLLELNASDERGIKVVREKIKHFAALSVGSSSSRAGNTTKNNIFQKSNKENHQDGDPEEGQGNEEDSKTYPNPPFKIIILDEADTVTPDAQAALRRVIEAYSKITRFILICNYVTKIIEPLASRCAKFRFQSLPSSSMMARLTTIAHAEQCHFSSDDKDKVKEQEVLEEILDLACGDMRRAVTTLQSVHTLSGGTLVGKRGVIQKDSIAEMAGLPPASIIDSLLSLLQDKSSSFDDMESMVRDVLLDGFAAQHILNAMLKKVIVLGSEKCSEIHKAEITIKIAEVEKNLIDGADEMLQLITVCSLMLRCFSSHGAT